MGGAATSRGQGPELRFTGAARTIDRTKHDDDSSESHPFVFMFLFNNNKGQGFAKQDPFAGDIAAFVAYRDELTEEERAKVRQYFDAIYGLKLQ